MHACADHLDQQESKNVNKQLSSASSVFSNVLTAASFPRKHDLLSSCVDQMCCRGIAAAADDAL